MHPFFTVSSQEIARLDDSQSRELIARLCRAEMRAKGKSQSVVTWGGDQRAKDGGVDVRVDLDTDEFNGEFVPRARTVFQVKSELFPESKIRKEMAPISNTQEVGRLRPSILALEHRNGAYIIASTRENSSDSALRDSRIKAMQNCLTEYGVGDKVFVDFYDCRRIADWVENTPAVSVWLKYQLGSPIVGWRPFGPWAYHETDTNNEYILDEKVRVHETETGSELSTEDAIDRIRGILGASGSVRIVGLSGVGKTRFVQSLFDNRIQTENAALSSENVLYADRAEDLCPTPLRMVEALISEQSDAVLVIDNCGSSEHSKLTERVMKEERAPRLITIEYDIKSDEPELTKFFLLKGVSDDVIITLLGKKYTSLSRADVDKIAEFSEGNVRLAYALADTCQKRGELSKLEDSELFQRLFLQSQCENDEFLRCAQVASLVYSFDGCNLDEGAELSQLAMLAEVTPQTFARHMADLKERGLLQQRSIWQAVLPQAISNRLAAQALNQIPYSIILDQLISYSEERQVKSFSRRLGYLHQSNKARVLARGWIAKLRESIFDTKHCTDTDLTIFENIAPIDQSVTLEAISEAAETEEFLSIRNFHRGRFVRITRKLAYDKEFFEGAVSVLKKFALVEPEDYQRDTARDAISSLFHMRFSGTMADLRSRSDVLLRLLRSNDLSEQALGFLCLKEALEANSFGRLDNAEFGARQRSYGKDFETHDELVEWLGHFIGIAVEIGEQDDVCGQSARRILGEQFRGLWTFASAYGPLRDAAIRLAARGRWLEGWHATRTILRWDSDHLNDEVLAWLEEIRDLLAPQDLAAEISAKILMQSTYDSDDDDCGQDKENSAGARWQRGEEEARSLGIRAAQHDSLIDSLLPELFVERVFGRVYSFGVGFGRTLDQHICFLRRILSYLAGRDAQSYSLIFLRGFLVGWKEVNAKEASAFLDSAIAHPVWAHRFPELQMAFGPDPAAFDRIMKSLDCGIAPAHQFQYLCWGRSPLQFDLEEIAQLVAQLTAVKDGYAVAVELLGMTLLSLKERRVDQRGRASEICWTLLEKLSWGSLSTNGLHRHHLEEILKFALDAKYSSAQAKSILADILDADFKSSYERHQFLKSILPLLIKAQPDATLRAIYKPDDHEDYWTARRLLSSGDSNLSGGLIQLIPPDVLFAWCDEMPAERFPYAAEIIEIFQAVAGADGRPRRVGGASDVAVALLNEAPDRAKVLEVYEQRVIPNSWSGSRAEIVQGRMGFWDNLEQNADAALTELVRKSRSRVSNRLEQIIAQEREEDEQRNQTFE